MNDPVDPYKSWLKFLETGVYQGESAFLKFAVLWLSFAGFLSSKYSITEQERQKLEKFKQKYVKFYENILKEAEFKEVLLKFSKTKSPSRKYVINMQSRDEEDNDYFGEKDIVSFDMFIEVIYQIRCNFFHGAKIPDEDNEKLIKWAYDSFIYFWKAFVAQYLN